jgi:hypothetical protein
MKKIVLLAMVLGLAMCFSVASQAQPSPEWAQIKRLALNGQKTEQVQWVRSWSKGSSLWICSYDKHHTTIEWKEIWYEGGTKIAVTCTYWETGQNAGKFKTSTRQNDVEILDYYISNGEGIKLGKQFINDIRSFIR